MTQFQLFYSLQGTAMGRVVGFLIQKRISLSKYLRLNLSKTGMSVFIGKRGLNLNIKGDQVTENIDLPDTGLSYREKISPKTGEQPIQTKQADQQESSRANRALISLVLLVLLATLYVYLQTSGAL